ncbi:MAG: ribonuclease III [Rikenellaceae bacterium]
MLDRLIGAYKRHFDQDKEYYAIFHDMFGYTPYNIDLYKLALIHKSASLVLEDGTHINNERLEYLGDAIIEAITSDYLYIEFPTKSEGFLTQMRSKIVSRHSLNRLAKDIGLHERLILSTSGTMAQKDVDGDAFEALIGAIYLDKGYDFVNRLLINKIFAEHLDLDSLLVSETDFKSRLIEWAQKEHHKIKFVTVQEGMSKGNKPYFHSTIIIGGVQVGQGYGESKKEAEQRAAHSVSQGTPSDEASDELLSRIDNYAKSSAVESPAES